MCQPAVHAAAPSFHALVFHKSTVFRHDSLPAGVAALKQLAAEHNFHADFTEDAAAFTTNNLARYQVVVFLNNCGDLFNDEQRAAFQHYIRSGGGFAGIHCPIDCEKNWAWFTQLLGTRFLSHPAVQSGTIEVEDPASPATAHLPKRWTRSDEWYSFQPNPRGKVHVLLTLDETTYQGGAMGRDHPIAWCHKFEGGRVFYTALGHTPENYSEPLFLQHIVGGIQIAAGLKRADFTPNADPHSGK
ncbi:MAG: ThuA domain-containing protein [Verrucomicrobia bacterium]|nr:ThuA domain-containing protein [Verrucomicrobiota bacterium]